MRTVNSSRPDMRLKHTSSCRLLQCCHLSDVMTKPIDMLLLLENVGQVKGPEWRIRSPRTPIDHRHLLRCEDLEDLENGPGFDPQLWPAVLPGAIGFSGFQDLEDLGNLENLVNLGNLGKFWGILGKFWWYFRAVLEH